MSYIHRQIEPVLADYLGAFPAVGLTGPRQSGKSTVLQKVLPEYTYVTFDDVKMRHYFNHDPVGFMQTYAHQVIFDEVQHVPEIFSAIKIAIDQDRQQYGKFVLTGSAQFTMIEKITESLAGRIGLLSLLPLQYNELPKAAKSSAIYRGSYPELATRNYHMAQAWYAAYLDTYLNRDVRQLAQLGDLRDFERFIHLLAARASQVLNMSDLSKDLGISVPTIKRWLSILEASYIIFLLPPFYENLGKRIIKSPKIYFYDTGLVAYLTGIQTQAMYEQGPMAGALFENYVIAEIYKQFLHQATDATLYYYRTDHGIEADLIIDFKHTKHVLEIKSSATFRPNMVKGLNVFIDAKQSYSAYLLYNGPAMPYHLPVTIMPWQDYLATI